MTNPQVNNIYNNINDEDRKGRNYIWFLDDANNFDQSEIEEFKVSNLKPKKLFIYLKIFRLIVLFRARSVRGATQ